MSEPVTSQYLLQGAVYALEQCGRLLRDANILHRGESYPTAVAVAAFAREELGRWKKLLALRSDVIAGKIITMSTVKNATKNHVRNQSSGMLSITLTGEDDPQAGALIRSRIISSPGSEEWIKTEAALEKIHRTMKERVPTERHRQRMSALYVEPLSDNHWNRPAIAISRSAAERFLIDAVNDYAVQYSQRYITDDEPMLKHLDEELFCALEQWSDRPTLPRPEWPHLSPSEEGTRQNARSEHETVLPG